MFFFFNDTATTEIYTLSLHDALPIFLIGPDEGTYLPVLDVVHKVTAGASGGSLKIEEWGLPAGEMIPPHTHAREDRSEEHTSELQSRQYLVCRLLLEKKKTSNK